MLSEITEYEVEMLEEDLVEIWNRLDSLGIEDTELRKDLLRNQQLIIKDLEIANKKLVSELKCVRNTAKFNEF